ncbi:MAG: glycosyltransferase family 39 protein [Tepidamorphaceae bacterium]
MTLVFDAYRAATSTHARTVALLCLLSLGCFLPGFFTLAPVDRDEARFVQSTRQMVETGDYIDIRFQDETRYKKPVGIYWLQAASVNLSGQGAHAPIWVYRIPSLLGAVAVVLLTYWTALALVSRESAVLAAALTAALLLLGVEARLARPMLCFAQASSRPLACWRDCTCVKTSATRSAWRPSSGLPARPAFSSKGRYGSWLWA